MPEAGAPVPISGCVLAYQEQDRIADCLRSLSFCDEVLVVDSGSTDRTREISEELGARVVVNKPFPGFAAQRQFGVDRAALCHAPQVYDPQNRRLRG